MGLARRCIICQTVSSSNFSRAHLFFFLFGLLFSFKVYSVIVLDRKEMYEEFSEPSVRKKALRDPLLMVQKSTRSPKKYALSLQSTRQVSSQWQNGSPSWSVYIERTKFTKFHWNTWQSAWVRYSPKSLFTHWNTKFLLTVILVSKYHETQVKVSSGRYLYSISTLPFITSY